MKRFLQFGCALLGSVWMGWAGTAAAAELAPLPPEPMVRVAKVARPPVIDGNPDDACWKQTVAIKDFLTFGAQTPASAATTARLAYDDANLYILLVCREPLLRTASQQQTDIIARVTQRDGKVLGDDSCLIFLQPDEQKPATYEFTVNTIGTLLDAKSVREQLWRGRDVSWNSNARVAVRRDDGYWVEELAIPLADLGVKVKAGDQWRIGLDRIAQSRHELSSWQPTNIAGAHAPVELARMIFAAGPVELTPAQPLTHLSPGSNTIKVTAGLGAAVEVLTRITGQKGSETDKTAGANGGTITHTFDVKQKEAVTARWAVLDAATGKPIYASPAIQLSVQSMEVALNLSTAGNYQITVNGRTLASGSEATSKTCGIPLRQGINVIAIRADSGRAKVSLDAPWMRHFNHAWRIHPAATPNATDAATDDSAWPIAKADGNGMFGQSNEPIILRRTILVDYTNVWPLPQPAWFIAGNSTQPITFTAPGLKGRSLDQWTTYVALPRGLEVVGSTGYYGNTAQNQPIFDCRPAGDVALDGQTLRLYRVTASKPIRAGRASIMSLFQVMLRIADPAETKPGQSWTLHYWSTADEGSTVEAPRSFELKALPPLEGKQPKQFAIQLWGSSFTAMDSEPLRQATLATAKAAGFNQFVAGSAWTTDAAKQYGLQQQMLISFNPWSLDLAPWLQTHADARLIDAKEKPNRQYMCMTLLLGKDWPVLSKILADRVKEIGADVVQYDYEFNPFTGPHSCFCDRCLAAFRQRSGLPSNTKLSPDLIKKQYKAKWEDFMAWRVATMFALMKATVHQARPGTLFSAYSGYQSPDTIARYGVDWRHVGRLHAVDVAGCGYGRSQQRIDDTIQALDGIPVLFGNLLHPYGISKLNPATVSSCAVILRRALDATGGVLVYARNTMDGRSWQGVAEASRVIATYEKLFLASKHLRPVAGQDPAAVTVLKGDDVALLCVMNLHSSAETYQFQLPADLGGGKEFYTGTPVATGAAIHLTLKPGEARVYVLRQ